MFMHTYTCVLFQWQVADLEFHMIIYMCTYVHVYMCVFVQEDVIFHGRIGRFEYSTLALKPECSDRPPDSGLNWIRVRGIEVFSVQMRPGPGSGFRIKLDPG
jgi:hypothetical protein